MDDIIGDGIRVRSKRLVDLAAAAGAGALPSLALSAGVLQTTVLSLEGPVSNSKSKRIVVKGAVKIPIIQSGRRMCG